MVNLSETKHWYKVCAVDEIGVNSLRKVEINGIPIVVVNIGNEYRAFPPWCPHMAEPLYESAICSDRLLTCSKHLWQWDLQTGEERGPAEKPLLLYDTAIAEGFIWVRAERQLVYNYDIDDDDSFEW